MNTSDSRSSRRPLRSFFCKFSTVQMVLLLEYPTSTLSLTLARRLGWYALPVESIRPGFRIVNFLDDTGREVAFLYFLINL